MSDLRCKHCKREYDIRQEKKCKGYCFDCWNCGVPELIEDRDRLAAENATFRVAWGLDPEDRVVAAAGPGEILYDRKGQRTRASLTSEEVVKLQAENARLRAALEIFDSIMIDTYRRPDDMARHRDGEESAFCIAWKSAREALARKEG